MAIDALRGFDMFWIAGGATLINSIDGVVGTNFTKMLSNQMEHAQWVGFTFMDIIMPLFLFITGCSMVFSFRKRLEQQGKRKVYRHVLQRFLVLWVLGMIYQGNLLSFDWSKIDFYSNTLQAIAIGYLGASLILLIKKTKWQLLITGSFLFIYWALINFTPGFELTIDKNLAIHIDKLVFPKHLGNLEYSWVLSSLTFIVTVMLGVFVGKVLTNNVTTKKYKLKYIAYIGIGLTVSGSLLALHEPCIKKIWSSSFTLISGGYCVFLLCLFYGLIDVLGYKRWALLFSGLGRNALLVYMVFAYSRFVNLAEIVNGIIYGTERFLGGWYQVVLNCGVLLLLWAIFYFLDKKKVYVKI